MRFSSRRRQSQQTWWAVLSGASSLIMCWLSRSQRSHTTGVCSGVLVIVLLAPIRLGHDCSWPSRFLPILRATFISIACPARKTHHRRHRGGTEDRIALKSPCHLCALCVCGAEPPRAL